MRHIARLAIRRPVPILIFWVGAFLVALLFAGKARDNLHETQLQIPGTAADRAAKLSEQQFGGSIAMAILLKAPDGHERDARSAGRAERLVRRLERIPDVDVLSPFAIGGDRAPARAARPGAADAAGAQARRGDLRRDAPGGGARARRRAGRRSRPRCPAARRSCGR